MELQTNLVKKVGNTFAHALVVPTSMDQQQSRQESELTDGIVGTHHGCSSFLTSDRTSSTKLADGLLKALDDQHGEVQNQALKWYAATLLYNSRIRPG